MNIARLLTFILLSQFLVKASNLTAQSDLRNHSAFFNTRIESLNEWLNSTGVGQVFYLDSIIVKKSKLKVLMVSKINDPRTLTVAWNTLKYGYDKDDAEALYRKIFNFSAFEIEVGKDSLEINYMMNKDVLFANVLYNKKNGIIVKQKNIKRGNNRSFQFHRINLELESLNISDGPVIEYAAGSNAANLKTTRNKINKYLTDYYATKGTFWYDAEIEILKETYNELTFEVTQLSDEILNDRNYFEYIRIEFKLIKNNDDFDIKIDVMGKYCGGFGFTPRRSEYRNMEADFKGYIQRYEDKLAIKIKRLLTE